jgi:hypothetical protein
VHLDIQGEGVHSVQDALSAFTCPETIHGAPALGSPLAVLTPLKP